MPPREGAVSADAAANATSDGSATLAALLSRLTQVSEAGGDARELTEWLLRHVAELTGWPVAQTLLVDPFGAVTIWFSSRNSETRWEAYTLALSSLAMRTPTGLIDRVITTRRPGWVTDIVDEGDYPRASAARTAGLRGVFAFPVVRGDQVVAVLQFLSPVPIEPDAGFQEAMRIAGHMLGAAFDRVRMDGESTDQPSRLHRVMDSGDGAFLAVDADGRVAEWTAGAERLFGWTRTEAMYRRIADLLLLTPLPAATAADGPVLRCPALTVQRRDGSTLTAELSHWHISSQSVGDYLFFRDISEREQRATGAARDPLTGLANRAALLDQLAERLAETKARGDFDGACPVLLLVGLQRFKEIDYSTDHQVADDALRVIGDRLAEFAREVDQRTGACADLAPRLDAAGPGTVVARIAGDEFGVLFDSLASIAEISRLAERVVDIIAVPFQVRGRRLAVTAYVGAAAPLAGSDAASWFGDADAALHRSQHGTPGQRTPRGRVEIEGFARLQGASWRRNLPAELQTALREGEFELYFQPVFALPERRVVGAEALIRWHHPQHGLLLPGTFIDAAEESGVIAPMGEWVLRTAIERLRRWPNADLQIAVNLCARQLADPGIVAQVAEAVGVLGASADHRLIVEMTESVLMADPAVAATRIGQFRDMGVLVAVDDFGTGYSSLAYLKWFDIDILKIDMSFVQGMSANRMDAAIVRSVVALARELDLSVVAEGAETEEQLRLLTDLGCSHVQGFALGRPMPESEFVALITRPQAG